MAPAPIWWPPLAASGLRESVNRNITPAQMVWNLRSAYNVAALNCTGPRHVELIPLYRAFLKTQASARQGQPHRGPGIQGQVRRQVRGPARAVHDRRLQPFRAARDDGRVLRRDDGRGPRRRHRAARRAGGFAVRSLPNIEIVFDAFYRRYDQYRTDLAIWKAQYGDAQPGTRLVIPAVASEGTSAATPQQQATGALQKRASALFCHGSALMAALPKRGTPRRTSLG
jgi:hypothetical protein